MVMLPHHLRTLEFDKVRAELALRCSFRVSEDMAHGLVPSADEGDVRRSQDATEEARGLLEARPNTGLRGAVDIRNHVRRAGIGGVLAAPELLDVASTISAGRSVKNLVLRQELRAPTLARFARDIADLDELESALNRSIDDEGHILDTASERLRKIRAELRSAYDRLMRRLNELITGSEIRESLQEPVVTMRGGRYVVPVKAEFRGRVRGIVHDQSASGATVFIEPLGVVDLANAWRRHEIEEQQEIEHVLRELSNRVGVAQYGLLDTVDALARIDLALAKGKLALEMAASRPIPLNRPSQYGVVHLSQARHPLLRGDVVPIDVSLGVEFDVLVITGPNTGGKTVALKTVGLLAVMAQAGLQIPAAEGSSLAIFSGVYADIGDEQSIEQSLSTFSSHVTHVVEVLRAADSGSLVLLDEIGAGTDPDEGAALSQAILQRFAERHIPTIATTHYSELKTFAHQHPRVQNASVEFDLETLKPTYRLTIGLPGKSNALAIAERLGMPSDVINGARSSLEPGQRRVDELIADVESTLRAARREEADAQRLKDEVARTERQLQGRLNALERDRAAVLQKAEEQRAATVAELQREADALRRELRGLKAERDRLAVIEQGISAIRFAPARAKEAGTPESARPLGHDLEPGDRVKVRSLDAVGVLQSLGPANVAEVDVGGIRVRVHVDELDRSMEAAREPATERASAWSQTTPATNPRRAEDDNWPVVESQLDLRGLTTEEARYRADRYLHDAYMEGIKTARIIHGKGTGAVRQIVRQLLSDHPLVRSHEGAGPHDGGDGATVVHLVS